MSSPAKTFLQIVQTFKRHLLIKDAHLAYMKNIIFMRCCCSTPDGARWAGRAICIAQLTGVLEFVLGFFLGDFSHVGGGYDTGWKGDDCHAYQGGNHCD